MVSAPKIRFLRDRHGQNVAYAVHGSGPLVICPVWWISHVQKDWDHAPFRSFFEQLGEGLTVVRYDRPGVGLSDRDAKSRTLQDEVDLLEDVAAELGGIEHALFAVSCAGPIAIHHAVRHPDEVSRMVFCDSFIDGPSICSRDVQDAVRGVVRAHWGMGSRALADIFFPDADAQDLEMFARQTRDSSSAETADKLLELTYSMSASDAADLVKAQCLVVHRNGDRAIPFEMGRELVARLPNAELVTLDGRAHPPWMDGADIANLANTFFHGGDGTANSAPLPDGLDRSNKGVASVLFDQDGKCVVIEGNEVTLTPIEFGIVRMLTERTATVVSRDDLLSDVWQQPYLGSNRVDVAISGLRRKLGSWGRSIETIPGHGYRFRGWRKAQ